MSDQIKILIPGPGPYGFRLSGGDGQPLAVVKLRQKSKAYESGLREGDVLMAINGTGCDTLNHAQAVSLLESSIDQLDLHVARGFTTSPAATTAYRSSQAITLTNNPKELHVQSNGIKPEIINENQQPKAAIHASPSDIKQSGGLSVTKMSSYVNSTTVKPQFAIDASEGEKNNQDFLNKLEEQKFLIQQGKVPENIKAEFKNKEEVIVYRHKPNMPGQSGPPLIGVVAIKQTTDKITDEDNEENCIPTKGCTAVSLAILSQETKDKSFGNNGSWPTIVPRSKPIESFSNSAITKEDLASYIKFRISQFPGEPWLWHPSQVYKVTSNPLMEEFSLDAITQQDIEKIREELIAKHLPFGKGETDDNGKGQDGGGRAGDDDDIPLHLLKVLTTIEDVDPLYWKRKKIYANSSFYDDAEHTYPTIQEQIKMARSVAKSLTAADNVKARGQRMFLKRKERSQFWDIDNPSYNRHPPPTITDDSYYNHKHRKSAPEVEVNPKPWNTTSKVNPINPKPWNTAPEVSKPWNPAPRVSKSVTPVIWEKKFEQVQSISTPITPIASEKPEIVWGPKNKVKVPDVFTTTEPLPRIQPRRSRSQFRPNVKKIAAQVGGLRMDFDQSDELINKKGKAAQRFAQRRTKSEERGDALPMFQDQDLPRHRDSQFFMGDLPRDGGSQFSLGRPLRAALDNLGRGGGDITSSPSELGVVECRLKNMVEEYWVKNNAWDYGGFLSRTESLFDNKLDATVNTTVKESKGTKGENGPRLKPKSSGGYRPVNFKSPVAFDVTPDPVPRAELRQDILSEGDEGGITDF